MARPSHLLGIGSGGGSTRVDSGGPLGWLLRLSIGMPMRGAAHTAELSIEPDGAAAECWTRRFGPQRWWRPALRSRLEATTGDMVAEHWGPVTLIFDIRPACSANWAHTMTLRVCRIGALRLGRRWASVDVDIDAQVDAGGDTTAGAAASYTAIRVRVLGGTLGRLDYSVALAADAVALMEGAV